MSHHANLRQGGFSQSRRRQRMVLLLVVVLCCLGSTEIVSAGVNAWTGIGPEGALVTSLAIDPTAPLILYAANYDGGGIFKTTNGGGNWSSVNVGLTNTNVTALAIDPRTPTTLYAGAAGSGVFYVGTAFFDLQCLCSSGSLFKSNDGGGSWSETEGFTVSILAIDPQTPTILYVATGVYRDPDCAGPNCVTGGLFRITDGGDKWDSSTNVLLQTIYTLAIDPSKPTNVYVGTDAPGYVFRSTDGGSSWSAFNTGLTQPVLSLAIDPLTPTTVYPGTPGGVFVVNALGSPGAR